mmetsp:Transcript_81119/g.173512  ORF Transcript_81119/g.173512 Transcript_81119/m.173512 type:complete len:302 (-) Transcript_81119:1910-2815(-)
MVHLLASLLRLLGLRLAQVRLLLELVHLAFLLRLHHLRGRFQLVLGFSANYAVLLLPLLQLALLLIREVFILDLSMEGHYRLPLPATALLVATAAAPVAVLCVPTAEVHGLRLPSAGLQISQRVAGAKLQLTHLLDPPLRGLGPLLVDARLLPITCDLDPALVFGLVLLHHPAVRRDHHGQVLLLLRVPPHHAFLALNVPSLIRQQVHLVFLHGQTRLLGLLSPVFCNAEIELFRRLLLRHGGRRGTTAQRRAINADVEACELGSTTSSDAALPRLLPARCLGNSRPIFGAWPRHHWRWHR